MEEEFVVSLDGTWKAAQISLEYPDGEMPDLKGLDFFTATVPGELHKDLMSAGRLKNLFSGVAACAGNQWVSEAEWVYVKEFDLENCSLENCCVILNFDSIDTFSDVFLNGVLVGQTHNAFIRQHFKVDRSLLKVCDNKLAVRLKGHRRMVADKSVEALQRCALDNDEGRDFAQSRSLTRRPQRVYNPELTGMGKYVTGIGLPKSVSLSVLPALYLKEPLFRVLRANDEVALIRLEAQANLARDGMTLSYALKAPDGRIAAQGECPFAGEKTAVDLQVNEPLLWWPNGYGAQNLYSLELALCLDGATVCKSALTVGIRQIELIRNLPNGKPTFQFRINGKPIYIFGGNLMPVDYLMATGSKEQSETILNLAAHTGINMMRLWGGGNNESEWFYRMCDRKGIMIFKDIHLHSHIYPDYDPEFVAEMRFESAETIRYLRNHPCFALICGGNEQQEGWDAWQWRAQVDQFYGGKLNYEDLAEVARQECPEIPYITNSPHGKKLSQSPVDGDTHTWGNYFNCTKDPQFVTETCWFYGSFQHPKTLEKFMEIKVDDFTGLGWAKKWRELTGQQLIGVHQYGEYHMLDSLREYMKSLSLEQYLADYNALFYLRCRSASCNGIIYWPFNKGGMFILYGCVDYDQRPLMSYYLLRRLFAPVACHLYRDVRDLRLVVSNAGWDCVNAKCVIRHMHVDGRELNRWESPVTIKPGNGIRIMDLPDEYESVQNRWQEMYRAEIYANEQLITSDDLYFTNWSEFENAKDAPTVEVLECTAGGKARICVGSGVLTKMVYMDSDTKLLFEDNCFSLMPGEKREILISPLENVKEALVTVESIDGGTVTVRVSF